LCTKKIHFDNSGFLHWEPQEDPLGAPVGFRASLPMGFRARRNAQRGLRERGALSGTHAVCRAGEEIYKQTGARSCVRDRALSVSRFQLVSRGSGESEHLVCVCSGASLPRVQRAARSNFFRQEARPANARRWESL
jgi:hypothetical protein